MSDNTKVCRKCKEIVQKWASKCKHCWTDLRSRFIRHPYRSFFLFSILILAYFSTISQENLDEGTNSSNALSENYAVEKQIDSNSISYTEANYDTKNVQWIKRERYDIIVDPTSSQKQLVELMRSMGKGKDFIMVKVYTSMDAYNDGQALLNGANATDRRREWYILSYQKTSASNNKITRMQSIGQFANLEWSTTDLSK